MSSTVKVNIKWGKELFKDCEVDKNGTAEDFRIQLFSLSNVPPERQKVMNKGKLLKDEEWDKFSATLTNGVNLMLIGTADELAKQIEKTTFAEELPPEEQERAITNLPPGLTNLGNTCYMNSVLQTMNSIPEFSNSVETYQGTSSNQDVSVSTIKSLKNVVSQLKTKSSTVNPSSFLNVLHNNFPQFAEKKNGILMQQDAEECWSQLLYCSKSIPSSVSWAPSIFEQLFEGKFMTTYKNLETEEEPATSIEETFSKLSCHISSEVDYLFQGVNLSLQEKIEKKSVVLDRMAQYEKTSKVTKLPYYLTIQFVRFFWRKDTQKKAKIVRPVDFPFDLDTYEFCADELKEKLRENRQNIISNDSLPENEKLPILQDEYSNNTGFYELYAVISHKERSADSGHYVAWVKESDDLWILFDDNKVSHVTTDDIRKLTGKGGADWHMAYICLYRTKQF